MKNELKEKEPIEGVVLWYLIYTALGFLGTILMGAVQIFANNGDSSAIALGIDVSIMLCYCFLCCYSIVCFLLRKPNSFYVARFHLGFLLVDRSLVVIMGLCGWIDESMGYMYSNPIVSVVSCVITLLFLIYFFAANDEFDFIPKSERILYKRDKWIFSLCAVVPIILFVCAVLFANSAVSSEDVLEQSVEQLRKELPTDIGNGTIMSDATLLDGNLILRLDMESASYSDLAPIDWRIYSESDKATFAVDPNKVNNPLLQLCSEASYGFVMSYFGKQNEELYTVTLTSTEVQQIFAPENTKSISVVQWKRILDLYEKKLPFYWYQDMQIVNFYLSDDMQTLNCDIDFVNLDLTTLSNLNSSTLSQMLIDCLHETPIPVVSVALMNGMGINFNFTSDTLSWWNRAVEISPDQI